MSPRPEAASRLRRVLAMVPYIAAHGEVSIAELAEAFALGEDEVLADLELLPFCGLPPYTPDRLIDLAVVDGYVSVRFAEYFSRPLRLTPAEGFALLAAGRALLAVPGAVGDGPLAAALDKLEAVLGASGVLDVEVGEPDGVDVFRRAAAERERLEIDYWSFHRDAVGTRRVDPGAVVSVGGQWYVAAWCHQAGDERLFRLDRVRAVRPTGERFEPRPVEDVPASAFHGSATDERVTLDLPASARWVVETHPTEEVAEAGDGRLRVVLAVSGRAWLERLLLQLGPDARVVAPPGLRRAAAEAARRVLARYDGAAPEPG